MRFIENTDGSVTVGDTRGDTDGGTTPMAQTAPGYTVDQVRAAVDAGTLPQRGGHNSRTARSAAVRERLAAAGINTIR